MATEPGLYVGVNGLGNVVGGLFDGRSQREVKVNGK